MAYYFYLGKMLCPVAPSKLDMKINGKNKTMTLINEGEVNLLKKEGLTDIDFEILLPNVKYPFAVYKSGFKRAKVFLDEIEKLKSKKNPFQFIVTRELPNGTPLSDTNMKVTLEDYTIKEDSKEGFDVRVSIKLKQYRKYGTKKCTVVIEDGNAKVSTEDVRSTENAPTTKTHTVESGDCLWNIAKKVYGDGSKYTEIYNANKDKISNPNLIYPGQELIIPTL